MDRSPQGQDAEPVLVEDAKAAPARSLRSNILMGTSARIVSIGAALVVSPVIVAHLGLETYGFWALLQSLILYVQLADGGFPSAGAAMVGRAATQREVRSVVAAVSAAMVPIGLAVVGVAFAFVALVPGSWSDGFPDGWQVSFVAVGVTVALTMVGAGFAAGVSGLERWDMQAAGQLAGQLVASIATVTALVLGGGMSSVACSLALGALVAAVVYATQAWRLGSLRVARGLLNRRVFKELVHQGTSMQVVALVVVTTAQADRYMLLPFASLSWIGAYDLGARVALSVKMLPTTSLGPVITRVAAEYGTGGTAAVKAYYPSLFKDCVRLGVIPLIAAYGIAFPVILAWLGSAFVTSAAIALLLGIGYALNFATGAGTSTARAAARAALDRDYSILVLAINGACTVAFGLVWGAWGVVAATTVSLILGSIWLIVKVDRWLGLDESSWAAFTDPGLLRGLALASLLCAVTVCASLGIRELGADRLEQIALAGFAAWASVLTLGGRGLLSQVFRKIRSRSPSSDPERAQ